MDIELQCESEHIIDFQKSTYAKDILIPNEMEKDLEMQYIKKLKSLQEENKNLKSKMNLKEDQEKEGSNNKIVSQIDEVHILTKKLDEIRLENEQLKNKDTQNKTILLEKERNYTTLKSEFSKKDEKINNLTEESRNLKSQIENMKQEFDNLRSELSKKSNKISELQQAYFHLEQENTVNNVS